MDTKDYYVAEYSHSQNNFHYDRLSVSIKRNLEAFYNKQPSDWIILGIFETEDEAIQFNNENKKQLENNSVNQ